MKNLKNVAKKFIPAVLSCLTLVLIQSANSSGCVYYNQPAEPKAISKFKKYTIDE